MKKILACGAMKSYSVNDSQKKQELGDVYIKCLRVSKRSVIFKSLGNTVRFFCFFFNQRDSNPTPSPFSLLYSYLEHTTMAEIHLGKKRPLTPVNMY